jgi:RNA polymerase sigma-70 factor, ECF subfamily
MGLDSETVRAFVDRDYARVVNVVTLVCGDRGRAEDAVQDALVRAWASRRRIDVLSAWVTTVALNRTRDVARRAAAESRAYRRLDVPLDERRAPVGDDTDHDVLDAALAALPRRQREVVALFYYGEFSVAEVAATLGVSEGTVKTSLSRARDSLARALAPKEVDDAVE